MRRIDPRLLVIAGAADVLAAAPARPALGFLGERFGPARLAGCGRALS